jgi:hypothetical protein
MKSRVLRAYAELRTQTCETEYHNMFAKLTPSGRAADGSEGMRRENDAFNSNREEVEDLRDRSATGREEVLETLKLCRPAPVRP